MAVPTMRVIVDGDSNKAYQRGDRVTGRVILVAEEDADIQSLKLSFAGNCITKTSRSLGMGESKTAPLRREYEEKIRLFTREQDILPQCSLAAKKYSWPFEFTFPSATEPRFRRRTRGTNYLREPHSLPPSFHFHTNVPGGVAQISYFVQARLVFGEAAMTKRCRVVLRYHPTPQDVTSQEAPCTSAVLYDQIWKSTKDARDEPSRRISRVLSKVKGRSVSARILPSILYPETVAPGQHIPIFLQLRNTHDTHNDGQGSCTIDSLSITISTFSTIMCGHATSTRTRTSTRTARPRPEDCVSKHITCIARTDMHTPAPFGQTIPLTSNFRLVDNAECVPSFQTYSITRRYALRIVVALSFGPHHFTVRSTTPLQIVPRNAAPPPTTGPADDLVDPLPRYQPREMDAELSAEEAPDYESLFALGGTRLGSESLLAPAVSRCVS
ncbi:hypothetical protein ACEQ8H_003829 [Pleosporales sp. CAS-2024a]